MVRLQTAAQIQFLMMTTSNHFGDPLTLRLPDSHQFQLYFKFVATRSVLSARYFADHQHSNQGVLHSKAAKSKSCAKKKEKKRKIQWEYES